MFCFLKQLCWNDKKQSSSTTIRHRTFASGETDWEALHREVQEELNISLISETLTEVMVVQEVAHGYTEPTWVTMRCFGADYTGEIIANSEIEAIAWLSYANLDRCAPATQRVLEYLHQQ